MENLPDISQRFDVKYIKQKRHDILQYCAERLLSESELAGLDLKTPDLKLEMRLVVRKTEFGDGY